MLIRLVAALAPPKATIPMKSEAMKVGVVGVGRVGAACNVVGRARLGARVALMDRTRARAEGGGHRFALWRAALSEAR